MSILLEIRQRLEDATQRVFDLENEIARHPEMPSVAANLCMAVRMQQRLEAEFSTAAEKTGLEICRYRAFDDDNSPKAGPALGAISRFQKLISVVHGSLKHGQKQRATVSSEVAEETLFGFGYAFTGSIGVVLTLSNERRLFETELDETFDIVFAMLKSRSPEDVLAHSEKLGPGAVAALYHWAKDNSQNGLGADIEWIRSDQIRRKAIVQRQEFSQLRMAIRKTTSKRSEIISAVGVLKAADTTMNRFKLKREGLPEISGTVEPGAIDDSHPVKIPDTYEASVKQTTTIKMATGRQTVQYHLLRLTPVMSSC